MPMLEEKTRVPSRIPVDTGSQHKQRRQMYLALGLLLTALLVVVVKDHQFWFGSEPSTTEVAPDETAATDNTPSQPIQSQAAPAPAAETAPPSTTVVHPAKAKPHVQSHAAHSTASAPAAAMISTPEITASRRALPPLEIEVVAGDQHRVVQPPDPSLSVDTRSGSPPLTPSSAQSADAAAVATNAGQRVRLSADTAQIVERPVEPNYPMLAKQMKVQGSVVLQALIGREGGIQDLRVLSGPAILSTAAMDAVKQWRFRPYLQSGQAIETEARITVNFTISTN